MTHELGYVHTHKMVVEFVPNKAAYPSWLKWAPSFFWSRGELGRPAVMLTSSTTIMLKVKKNTTTNTILLFFCGMISPCKQCICHIFRCVFILLFVSERTVFCLNFPAFSTMPSPSSRSEEQPSDRDKDLDPEGTSGKVQDNSLDESKSVDSKPSSSGKHLSTEKISPSSSAAGLSQDKKRKLDATEYELRQAAKKHQKQEEERMKMQ